MNPRAVLISPPSESDYSIGNAGARVALVEYGDFECRSCGEAYHAVKKLRKRFGKNLKFIFRNFPLTESHPNAMQAAVAAKAAGYQGKFWDMYEQMYEHQDALERNDLIKYARRIGLDAAAFEKDLDDEVLAEEIKEELWDGRQSGVHATPTFFVNGRRFDETDYAALEQVIEERIGS